MDCRCQEGGVHLQLPVILPPSFSLQKAVCSYGFFMTAPNLWIDGVLERPLRLSRGQAVLTRTFLCSTSSSASPSLITCLLGLDDQQLTGDDRDCIAVQVLRMLRLSDMESSAISNFHALHLQAKAEGFGRLFRSPTLFEDMVKSCLLCNCGWGRTLSMARALCELQAELKGPPLGWLADGSLNKSKELQKLIISPATPEVKDVKRKRKSRETLIIKARKLLDFEKEKASDVFNAHHSYNSADVSGGKAMNERIYNQSSVSQSDPESGNMETSQFVTEVNSCIGDFPSAEELAGLDVSFLAKRCGLGYRAKHILKLAKDVCTGVVDLKSFETLRMGGMQVEDVRRSLLHLQGFGPFTCANVIMCIGEFSSIPADTETVRHLKQVYGRKCTVASVAKEVMEVYASYAPFQFLAYWFELWGCYEKRFGQLSCMDPQYYGLITGWNMSKKEQGASIDFEVA